MNCCKIACFYSIIQSIFLTVLYVASLYIWRNSSNRDHPSTIKRRFFSVTCMMILAPFYLYYAISEMLLVDTEFLPLLGIRYEGLILAIIIPWFLTAILFLGPLTMLYFSGFLRLYTEPMYWLTSCRDLVWVRNQIMAPLSEEWVFRACLIPLLVQCFTITQVIFIGPLFFGIAHFHHMVEQINCGITFPKALAISTFQFFYTSIFGSYSAYLFVRTDHFAAPLVAHMFCNHMGFPNFSEISSFRPLQKTIIMFNFILGVVLWLKLLPVLTHPDWYRNELYYSTDLLIPDEQYY